MALFLVVCSCASGPGPVKRQMVGLTEKFDRWDYNGDGQLGTSELVEAERLSGYTAAEIIRFYDTGGDGLISLRETQDGMSRLGEAQEIAEEKGLEQ